MLKEGLITFVFDDGNATDYTDMKPIFDKYKVPACCAVVTNEIGENLTIEQLREMENDGWEIMSHSKTHPILSELPEEEVVVEARDSRIALEALGLSVDNFVYPSHAHNPTVQNVVRQFYRSARGGYQGINIEPLNISALSSVIINYETSLEDCTTLIDKAIKEKRWLIFYLHATDIKNAVANPKIFMEVLLSYIKSYDVKVVTTNKALDIIGDSDGN